MLTSAICVLPACFSFFLLLSGGNGRQFEVSFLHCPFGPLCLFSCRALLVFLPGFACRFGFYTKSFPFWKFCFFIAALQAVFYQLTLILMGVLGFICYFLSFFLSFGGMFLGMFSIPLAAAGGETENPLLMILLFLVSMLPVAIPFAVIGVMLLAGLSFLVYGVVGAIYAMQGKAFAYVFIGKRVRAFLAEENNKSVTG